jgi:hypothetical protein
MCTFKCISSQNKTSLLQTYATTLTEKRTVLITTYRFGSVSDISIDLCH